MKNNSCAYVYILTNYSNTTLYVGVTTNLAKRIYEHKNKVIDGFSKRYNLTKLVYLEQTDSIVSAIEREKYLKGKKREFKINLINSINKEWNDLSDKFF